MISIPLFFGNQSSNSSQLCLDFTTELADGLSLFGMSFLAPYFPQFSAFITTLLGYLFFTKAFPKPKKTLAIISLPIIYFLSLKISIYLINNIFSYCIK